MAILRRGNSKNSKEVQWDLGAVNLRYVLEERGEATEGRTFQKSGLEGQPRRVPLWTLDSL